MAEIDPKAQALSAAMSRIIKLQEQMTDKVLQMAAEIEKLTETVPAAEVKSFLKIRCNLPATELSTYLGFAKALKGKEQVLSMARASFPVLKALVSADAETRREILERMEIGARIDTKDVAHIHKRLAAARLTASAALTAENKKIVAAAARRHIKGAILSFEKKISSLIAELLQHYRKGSSERVEDNPSLRHQAGLLLTEFETLFGGDQPALASLRHMSPEYRIALAHKVLRDVSDGRVDKINEIQTTALRALSGEGRVSLDPRRRQPLMALPPVAFRPRVIELCAGAGGLALGLERAGFEHVALIEYNRNAVATLLKNRPHWPIIASDLRKVDFTHYRKQSIDLLTGGLPCTPYSTVGNRKGQHDEKDLIMEGVRAVREVAPKAFAFENVDGLLHSKHSDYVASLLRKFSKLGYVTDIHRINSRDYGLAQDRSRIMIVGFRKDLAGAFRMPPKFPGMATNLGDALHELMSKNGWTGAEAWARNMRERPQFDRFGNFLCIGALSDTIRGRQGAPFEGEARRALKNGVSYAPPVEKAPTNEDALREGFLPGLTNRMRAKLQGFPEDWVFVGELGPVANQIGNAVAPPVAQAMGLALLSALKGWAINWEAMMQFESGGTPRTQVTPPAIDGGGDSFQLERMEAAVLQ